MTRVELGRSKARVDQWEEEVDLVKEEMRRVLVYLRWKANDWIKKAHTYQSDFWMANEGAICYKRRP